MTTRKDRMGITAFWCMALFWANTSYAAVDSYRYMHVSVQTPYTIFLFLLMGILAPFVLMGILVWRFVGRKPGTDNPSIPPQQEKDGE